MTYGCRVFRLEYSFEQANFHLELIEPGKYAKPAGTGGWETIATTIWDTMGSKFIQLISIKYNIHSYKIPNKKKWNRPQKVPTTEQIRYEFKQFMETLTWAKENDFDEMLKYYNPNPYPVPGIDHTELSFFDLPEKPTKPYTR